MSGFNYNMRMCALLLYQEHYDSADKIKDILDNYRTIKEYAFILHDKDVAVDSDTGETYLKKAHWHVFMRFGYPFDTTKLVKWFPNTTLTNIGAITSKKFEVALPYLIHKNDPKKYQYPESDVVSNFDWQAFVEGKLKLEDKDADVKKYIMKCATGELREFDICAEADSRIPPLIYAYHKTKLLNACEYYKEVRLKELASGFGSLRVLFFTGDSGSGKTSFSKWYCEQNKLSYYASGASNDPLEKYKGQDVLFLEDARDHTFSYTDLLKILDPNIRTGAKSRYSNKTFIGHTIIITTNRDIKDWYARKGERDDDGKQQFLRRIDEIWRFTKPTISVSTRIYDESTALYSHAHKNDFKNPMNKYFKETAPVDVSVSPMLKYLEENYKPVDYSEEFDSLVSKTPFE